MKDLVYVIKRRGGSRIFFRRGCTRLLLYFNTNKPHSFFCRIPVVLEKARLSQGEGGGGAHPLHPPPRSAPETKQPIDLRRWQIFFVDKDPLIVRETGTLWLIIPSRYKWFLESGMKLRNLHSKYQVMVMTPGISAIRVKLKTGKK